MVGKIVQWITSLFCSPTTFFSSKSLVLFRHIYHSAQKSRFIVLLLY